MSETHSVIVSDDDSNAPPPSPCPNYSLIPCIFERECQLLDTIMEDLFVKQDDGTYLRAEDNVIVNNDNLRFTAYHLTADWIAAYLGAGNRPRLTACIHRQINQRWPPVNGSGLDCCLLRRWYSASTYCMYYS